MSFVRTELSRDGAATRTSSKGMKMRGAGTIVLDAFHTVLTKARFERFTMSSVCVF